MTSRECPHQLPEDVCPTCKTFSDVGEEKPAPWAFGKIDQFKNFCNLYSVAGGHIANIGAGVGATAEDHARLNANVAHIVKCVNAHDTLRAALQRIATGNRHYLNHPNHERDYKFMRAIIDVCADIAEAALKAKP
jgi:hypothetical protein